MPPVARALMLAARIGAWSHGDSNRFLQKGQNHFEIILNTIQNLNAFQQPTVVLKV
jgi:hypothetical protein